MFSDNIMIIALHGTLGSHPVNDDEVLASYVLPCDARAGLTVSLISGSCNLSTALIQSPAKTTPGKKMLVRPYALDRKCEFMRADYLFFYLLLPRRNN